MNTSTPIIVKRGFLSALVYGISGIVITAIVCASSIGFYALNVVDRKSENLVDMVMGVMRALPDVEAALPPILSDAISDQRDPEYLDRLDMSVELVADPDDPRISRPVITVRNKGDQSVSLLAMRLVFLDASGAPVMERTEYVATPLAAGDEFRGPILPGSERKLAARGNLRAWSSVKVEYEITDLRVWNGDRSGSQRGDRVSPSAVRLSDGT
jgi:hypothetical protein